MTDERSRYLEDVVSSYRAQRDRYEKMAREVARICGDLLGQHAIRGNVQWRVKDPGRLLAKIQNPKFASIHGVNDMLARIGDLSAARITTYVETDREKVVARLKDRFDLVGEPDIKDGKSKSRFYRATHVQLKLPAHELVGQFDNLADVSCEVQVCSMLAHVYNEIEHDLGYKPFAGELAKAEVEALDAIGNIVTAGDTLIVHAIQRVEERNRNENDPFADLHDFISRTRLLFPEAKSFADNAGQLYDLFGQLGVTSPSDVRERFLAQSRSNAHASDLLQRLNVYLEARYEHEDVAIRYLPEPASSDQLMASAVSSGDGPLLTWIASPPQGRPNRLRYLATAMRKMLDDGG